MNDSAAVVLGLLTFVLFVVLYVWTALALSGVFRKAGEQGWKGWVPILNQIVLLQLAGLSPLLVLLLLVPPAYYVVQVIACYRINRSFGYGAGMTVLAALLFVIWASVLGFGSARWIGAADRVPGPVRGGSDRPAAPPAPPLVGGWSPATTALPAIPAPAVPPPLASTPLSVPPGPAAWAPPTPTAASGHAASPAAYSAPPPPPSSAGLDDELEDSAVDPEDRLADPAVPATPAAFTPAAGVDRVAPPAAPRPPDPIAPIVSVPGIGHPADPAPPVVEPVRHVPEASPAPEPEPWAPVRSRPPAGDADVFLESSESVSAVAGVPDAGAPRSALSSVSALYAQSEIPDDDEGIDQTIIARRRRIPWLLIPPSGVPIDISSEVVILGRRPAPDPAYPGAQLVSIPDETRTVSKTHARLELRGDTWYVTDLGSTNGVLFATLMGTEVEAQPGQELEAGERFFLGDAEVRLKRGDG